MKKLLVLCVFFTLLFVSVYAQELYPFRALDPNPSEAPRGPEKAATARAVRVYHRPGPACRRQSQRLDCAPPAANRRLLAPHRRRRCLSMAARNGLSSVREPQMEFLGGTGVADVVDRLAKRPND